MPVRSIGGEQPIKDAQNHTAAKLQVGGEWAHRSASIAWTPARQHIGIPCFTQPSVCFAEKKRKKRSNIEIVEAEDM